MVTEPRPLVTVQQAALIIGRSVKTIYSWRDRGYVSPALIEPTGRQLFDLDELEREAATDRRRRVSAGGGRPEHPPSSGGRHH